MQVSKSKKLLNIFYDIRGAALEHATLLETQGTNVLKLNIGNPALFGFNCPNEIIQNVINNLQNAQGYSDSKGLLSARTSLMQYYYKKKINLDISDIYIGNGVSELILISMQSLLNNDDEVLIPRPTYPLWSAAIRLAGGTPVYYMCDENINWWPDVQDIKIKITKHTKALVIINPNNPTGSVYSLEILEEIVDIARKNKLILFSDEIYDQIVFDNAVHISTASLSPDILCITFNGLSKSSFLAGFRSGWMLISGDKSGAQSYIAGLNLLTNMRLCANVPGQYAIPIALKMYSSHIKKFIAPGGRLLKQRNYAYKLLNEIPSLSCVIPMGAVYAFPKINKKMCKIYDDEKFVFDLLISKNILVVPGTAFNWPYPDHFRIVTLPPLDEIGKAIVNIGIFINNYNQSTLE